MIAAASPRRLPRFVPLLSSVSVAPESSVKLAAEVAVPAPESVSVPAAPWSAPVNEFTPVSVRVPVPFLVMPPPVPLMIPAKLVLVLFAPRASVPLPSVTFPPEPPPASEPMEALLPARSSATPAALASVTAVEVESAAPPLSCRMPALIAVAPVNELVPASVSVPDPLFAIPPLPLIAPE